MYIYVGGGYICVEGRGGITVYVWVGGGGGGTAGDHVAYASLVPILIYIGFFLLFHAFLFRFYSYIHPYIA